MGHCRERGHLQIPMVRRAAWWVSLLCSLPECNGLTRGVHRGISAQARSGACRASPLSLAEKATGRRDQPWTLAGEMERHVELVARSVSTVGLALLLSLQPVPFAGAAPALAEAPAISAPVDAPVSTASGRSIATTTTTAAADSGS